MKYILLTVLIAISASAFSQQFISTANIEYEVKVNNHRSFEGDAWMEGLKDKVPQFSITYYDLTFTDNKSIYKFNRFDEKTRIRGFNRGFGNVEDNIWYNDFNTGRFANNRFIDDNYLITGAHKDLKWKLVPNETREIAGFNCRKAQAVIFDSVYVFAFYSEELTLPGGPMGINGLPGTVLGLTIPRMFTSWVATKVQVAGVDTKVVAIPTKGKQRETEALLKKVQSAVKDWGKWGQALIWDMFL